jgi:two-component system chemotaxis sensor kinase CheA
MDEYVRDFVQESTENVTELNNALLELEADPDDEAAMDRIFRTAHTLKGNAGAMGFDDASDLAHAIEDLLDAVRSGQIEVTADLMDDVFDAVDRFEAMLDDVREHGEIRTDASDTIERLRAVEAEATGAPSITDPSDDDVESAVRGADDLDESSHTVYHVRLAVVREADVNNAAGVVDALEDAFDLLGTVPPRDEIVAGDSDGRVDAVFGSAVTPSAIEAALDPVDAVDDWIISDVTETYDAVADEPDDADGAAGGAAAGGAAGASGAAGAAGDDPLPDDPAADIDEDVAKDMSVDELLGEFDEYDDLDALVEEMDDVSGFDDLGDAGSFDDLDLGDDVEPVDEPAADPLDDGLAGEDALDLEGEGGELDADDAIEEDLDLAGDDDLDLGEDAADAAAGDGAAEAADAGGEAPADEEVEDAAETFAELKEEVDPVGFDELQDELDELEFDEYSDEEEVGFDELLGEDYDEGEDEFFGGGDVDDDALDDVLVDEDTEVPGFDEAEEPAAEAEESVAEAASASVADAAPDAAVDADDAVDDVAPAADDAAGAAEAADATDADAPDVEADASETDAGAVEADDEPAEVDAESAEAPSAEADDEPAEVDAESAEAPSAEADDEPAEGVAADADDDEEFAVDEPADELEFDEPEADVDADEGAAALSFDEPDDDFGFDQPERDGVEAGADDLDVDDDFDLDAADPSAETTVSTPDDAVAASDDEATEPSDEPASAADIEADLAAGDFDTGDLETGDLAPDPELDLGDEDASDIEDATAGPLADSDEEDLESVEVDEFELDEADADADAAADSVGTGDFGADATTEVDADASASSGVDDAAASPGVEYDGIDAGGFDDVPEDAGTAEVDVPEGEMDPGEARDLVQSTLPSRDDGGDGEADVQSVRVDIEQVDRLLNLVEGLVTNRVRLRRTVDEGADPQQLENDLDELEDITGELQDTVMDIRLVPLNMVANQLPRVVRDVSREQDKQVDFEMEGADVEMDRTILDEISDPLVHLVRNAVDHGIESPEERADLDKPDTGQVTLRAERERDRVIVEVEDDGRGLDPDVLRDAAVEHGIMDRDEADALDDDDARELVFHPGLSTATEVTDVSGRGVGMDVVQSTVADLDGEVEIESERGVGTTIRLVLPVSVAIDDVLFVECGDEEYGVPTKVVRDIDSTANVVQDGDREVVRTDGEGDDTPLIRLGDALDAPGTQQNGDGMLLHVRGDVRDVALHCDYVTTQQEVVVKPFDDVLGDIPGLSGATVLGDGEVVNILDVNTL